jgi:pimeloyl-ACP methyl ester carboxylesterase
MFRPKYYCFVFIALLFLSCAKETIPDNPVEVIPPLDEEEKVESNILSLSFPITYSKSTLENVINLAVDLDHNFTIEDVSSFKITFQTRNYENTIQEASGVVFLPRETEPKGIVFLQHSTIHSNDDAPSNGRIGVNEYTLGSIYAASGYLTLMPDHIGYGSTSSERHLYEVKQAYALSSYDMLRAGHSFLTDMEFEIPESLFLVGYSNGGYATLAFQQYLEEEAEVEITSTYAGAGAYDKSSFAKSILFKDEDLTFIGTYLWVLDVYNSLYPKLNRDWNEYLQEPYASTLESLGEIRAAVPDSLITLNPKNLFTENFINGILDGTDEVFLGEISKNDVIDWSPKAPISLYHGTLDDFVFPVNSENAFESLRSNGGTVEYKTIEGKDHQAAAIPFFLELLEALQ